MPKTMLIDAAHAEETRVVVVDGNRVEDFDFEVASTKLTPSKWRRLRSGNGWPSGPNAGAKKARDRRGLVRRSA